MLTKPRPRRKIEILSNQAQGASFNLCKSRLRRHTWFRSISLTNPGDCSKKTFFFKRKPCRKAFSTWRVVGVNDRSKSLIRINSRNLKVTLGKSPSLNLSIEPSDFNWILYTHLLPIKSKSDVQGTTSHVLLFSRARNR